MSRSKPTQLKAEPTAGTAAATLIDDAAGVGEEIDAEASSQQQQEVETPDAIQIDLKGRQGHRFRTNVRAPPQSRAELSVPTWTMVTGELQVGSEYNPRVWDCTPEAAFPLRHAKLVGDVLGDTSRFDEMSQRRDQMREESAGVSAVDKMTMKMTAKLASAVSAFRHAGSHALHFPCE
tara:strand:+ start:86 stop:619 length:534 start_codon:yes stop_codon:yes gene_type:complete